MNASVKVAVVADEAQRFLDLLAPSKAVTFQTFDDRRAKDRRLSRVMHGTLAEHAAALASLNARGAGVFVMVNEGDGRGRTAGNVRCIGAYFADFDEIAPPPIETAPLLPHCAIESSPGRWHWYWMIEAAPLESFAAVQLAIAERFSSDDSVKDLCRVMRLPGFLHNKREAFQTRISELRDTPRYTYAQFIQAFAIELNVSTDKRRPTAAVRATVTPLRRKPALGIIAEGERNATMLSLAAGFVRQGFDLRRVNDRLQLINAERCQPRLDTDEVDDIAARAVAYGSDGFAMLPHNLTDSPEWQGLKPPAHDIALTWFRRYNGANADNIALTWADFAGRPGFGKKDTFYRHRSALVQAGILLRASVGRNTQTGRKPDLFVIAPKWLRHIRQPLKRDLAPVPERCTPT